MVQNKVRQDLEDDSIVDMGRVDADDVEPIADIISDEFEQDVSGGVAATLDFDFELELDDNQQDSMQDTVVNGEDDTVMVTPEVLAAMQDANEKENSQIHAEQQHESHIDDKGDTVFVESKKMKAFREKLNKLDDQV